MRVQAPKAPTATRAATRTTAPTSSLPSLETGGPAACDVLSVEAWVVAVEGGAEDGGGSVPSSPPASAGAADVGVVGGAVVVVVVDGTDVVVDGGGGEAAAVGGGTTPEAGRGSVVVVVGAAVVVVAGAVVVVTGAAVVVVTGAVVVVVVGALGSTTWTRPTILGWRVQRYVNVPTVSNRNSNWPPGPRRSPESNSTAPGSEVTVWRLEVLLVQRTLLPTLIVVVPGLKRPSPLGSGLGLSSMFTPVVKAAAGVAVANSSGPSAASPAAPASSTVDHFLPPRTFRPSNVRLVPSWCFAVFRPGPPGVGQDAPVLCIGGPGGGTVKDALKDFKIFILRGNVVDLAIGVAIGAAFATVVKAFTEDLLMPIVAIPGTKPDFSSLDFHIRHSTFRYGAFINEVISFVIIAAALFFFVVRPINMLMARRKTEPDVMSTTRDCPYCLSSIPLAASRCAFCTADVGAASS